jgi:hypothetical protein
MVMPKGTNVAAGTLAQDGYWWWRRLRVYRWAKRRQAYLCAGFCSRTSATNLRRRHESQSCIRLARSPDLDWS